MAKEQNIPQNLYDLLVTRGFDPETTDQQGKPSQPAEARVMSFDWVSSSGTNYGTAVAVITDDRELMLFFGDNLGKGMEEQDKDEWFRFLQQLKQFSTRHDFHTFSPRNINQLRHTMAGMAAIREGLFESYYGTRQVSYMGKPTEARLMIRHSRPLGEGDARHRHVAALFIETADQERFRLPFVSLAGGRAMLEHVRQGGRPYDIRGSHIANLIQEAKLLSRFRRASQGRVLEGITQEVVNSADVYYQNLRENLRALAHARGYHAYFETWTADESAQSDALVEDLKTLFVEQSLDQRIEEALPLLARIQGTNMKEAEIFESWINDLAEGTWSIPDTPENKKKLEELMSQELPVGPDATNATEQLYDLFGDDELFDRLSALADRDPDADARDVIRGRASELGIDLSEQPAQPAQPAQPEQPEQILPLDSTQQPAPGQQDTKQVAENDYDDEYNEDESDLYSGAYVRDKEDGDRGEIFVMRGDPEDRRVRIEDQDGRGWYIAPYRLVAVDDSDPDISRWFPQQDNDMSEGDNLATFEAPNEDSTDAMDHRGAVTDSFMEDLAKIKRLALSN